MTFYAFRYSFNIVLKMNKNSNKGLNCSMSTRESWANVYQKQVWTLYFPWHNVLDTVIWWRQ